MARQQQLEELTYPLAKETTTVGGVFRRLGLLRGAALRKDIRERKITVDGQPVATTLQRVGPGQTIVWGEYRIRLRRDETAKRMRLEQELMRSGGFRGMGPLGNGLAGGMGGGKR